MAQPDFLHHNATPMSLSFLIFSNQDQCSDVNVLEMHSGGIWFLTSIRTVLNEVCHSSRQMPG